MQTTLFPGAAPATPPRWIGYPGPWGQHLAWRRPDIPVLTVRRTGHGQATYPYYITAGTSLEPLNPPGLFRTLAQAQAAAEAIHAAHARPRQ